MAKVAVPARFTRSPANGTVGKAKSVCAVLGFLPFYLGAWRRANKRVVGKIGIWMSNLDQKRFLTPKSSGSKDLCGTTEWEMHNDCALFGCSKTHSEQQF